MDNIVILTEDNFESEVLKSAVPAVVDFWAPWCGPCKAFAPIFADAAAELSGKVKFCKLDVDEAAGIARRYGVMTIPTVMVFKGGEPIATETGMRPKPKLLEIINRSL